MSKKITLFLIATFAILIGLYPFIYLIVDRTFGLLQSKSPNLLSNFFWNLGFYTHIFFGGLSLLIGWIQFNSKIRKQRAKLHRVVGKAYIISVLLSSIAAIYIAFYATGGVIASLGFIGLGCIWFYTTIKSYFHIKNGDIDKHQYMMIYSYAVCFSAVTLRIYLPLLILLFNDFIKAYLIVAWLCWIPNIIVAYFIVKKIQMKNNFPNVVLPQVNFSA